MANPKEVHFFDDESQFLGGSPDYETYRRYFPFKESAVMYGGATPIYFYCSGFDAKNLLIQLAYQDHRPASKSDRTGLVALAHGDESKSRWTLAFSL